MRHIASVVVNGMAQYALVDEETGELTQFAQILVPEGWDLHSSALLGTNLVQAIGLNGKRPKGRSAKALPAGPPSAQLDFGSELGAASEVHSPPSTKQKRKLPEKRDMKVQWYLPADMVWEVIRDYPDGITARQIAERIWRAKGDGSEELPEWVRRTVENRIATATADAKAGRFPLPFRVEYRPFIKNDGTPSNRQTVKYMLPPEVEQ